MALRLGEPRAAGEAFRGVWRATSQHPRLAPDFPLISLDLVVALAAAGHASGAERLCQLVDQTLDQRSGRPALTRAWRQVAPSIASGPLSPPSTEAFRRFLWRAWSDPRAELGL